MTDRPGLVALSAMVVAWLLAGCGSYDNEKKNTGGSGATGGSSGAATGGSSGAATGGSSGAATGGSSGAATGGSSGAAGSSGSGTQAGSGAGGGAGMGGGSGGQVACTDADPCGGDLAGTWVAAGCELNLGGMANLVSAGIGCTEAPITGTVTVSGTWTATSDGMITDNTTTAGDAVLELAAACLMISGTSASCDRMVFDSSGLVGVVCVDNEETEGCTCTVPINQSGGMASVSYEGSVGSASSATYTTDDDELVTTASGLVTEYAYCVADNTLTMTLTTPSNAGTVTGPIVLQKQ